MNKIVIFDRKFFKFALVGLINTTVGAAIMFLLYNVAHLTYWLSSACNYFFTSFISFFLNKYFTFGVKRWSVFIIVSFIMTMAVSYFIAYGISKPAMNYLLRDSPQEIRENVALFTGMCFFMLLNYVGQRYVVYKKAREEE